MQSTSSFRESPHQLHLSQDTGTGTALLAARGSWTAVAQWHRLAPAPESLRLEERGSCAGILVPPRHHRRLCGGATGAGFSSSQSCPAGHTTPVFRFFCLYFCIFEVRLLMFHEPTSDILCIRAWWLSMYPYKTNFVTFPISWKSVVSI